MKGLGAERVSVLSDGRGGGDLQTSTSLSVKFPIR